MANGKRQPRVISCVLLYDSISGLYVYTVGLWWIILTLDRWSMTSANTISHTAYHAYVFKDVFFCGLHTVVLEIDFKQDKSISENFDIIWWQKILVTQRTS